MTEQEQIDADLMAALFVSDEGELRCVPKWLPEGDCGAPPSGWSRPFLDEAVAAGILQLMRERAEARNERDAALQEVQRFQIRLDAVVENRDAMQEERDEALAELEKQISQ